MYKCFLFFFSYALYISMIETRIDFAVTLVHYLEATSENEIALE